MKAVVIERPGRVVLRDVPDPVPLPNEVLIRPKAGGVCGTDVHILNGDFIGNYPVIPCHEFSGVIADKGEKVTEFEIGDAVAVDPNIRCGNCLFCKNGQANLCEKYEAVGVTRPGGFAEGVCVPVENVHLIKNCDFPDVSFAEPLACVLYGQSRFHMTRGHQLIIWGAGAIGLLHLLVAKHIHDAEVTVVDQHHSRIEIARRCGARHILLSDEALPGRLKHIRPQGWDIAVDATGDPDAAGQMFRYLRRGGQALLFGVYPKDRFLSLSLFEIFYNDWQIHGSFTYRDEFSRAVKMLASGVFDTSDIINHRIPLNDAPDVLLRLAAGERLGKIQIAI